VTNKTKGEFLETLTNRYGGSLRKLDRSQSLYEMGGGVVRIYIRYSKVHPGNRTFYGLREEDLQRLEGHPSRFQNMKRFFNPRLLQEMGSIRYKSTYKTREPNFILREKVDSTSKDTLVGMN
jgi:hypothetical protein